MGRKGGKLRISCGDKIDRCGEGEGIALEIAVNVSSRPQQWPQPLRGRRGRRCGTDPPQALQRRGKRAGVLERIFSISAFYGIPTRSRTWIFPLGGECSIH